MVWTSLSFNSGDILPAAQMNQLQGNFDALAAQNSGSPKIDVSCAAADLFEAQTIITSGIRAGVGSFGTLHVTSANIDNLQADIFTVSGFQADIFSTNILIAGSAHINFLSTSGFYADIGSFNILAVDSSNIGNLISSDFRAGVCSFGTLHATSAAIDNVNFNVLVASDFRSGIASASLLNAGSAHINFLSGSNFYANVVSFEESNVNTAVIQQLNIDSGEMNLYQGYAINFRVTNIISAGNIYTMGLNAFGIGVNSAVIDYIEAKDIYVNSFAQGVTQSRYDNSSSFATTAYADDIRQVDVSVKTSSYTSALNDNVIQFDNSTNDLTYTLSQNSAIAYPTGKIIEVRKTGAGDITINKNGMTFAGVLSDSNIKLDGQHGYSVFLEVTSVNNWLYQGNLKSV